MNLLRRPISHELKMQVEAARWALLCGPIDGVLSVLGLTCHYKFQAPPDAWRNDSHTPIPDLRIPTRQARAPSPALRLSTAGMSDLGMALTGHGLRGHRRAASGRLSAPANILLPRPRNPSACSNSPPPSNM